MTSAQQIIEAMKVQPTINIEFEIRRRIDFIKNTLVNSGLKNLVLGISGGIDSSTLGKLAQLAINELNEFSDPDISDIEHCPYQFFAVRLPYATQADERDAQNSITFINPSVTLEINVKDSTDSLFNQVESQLAEYSQLTDSHFLKDFTKGNTKARMRMAAQYHIAGLVGGLVLGTDHSAENITGFFTKWGDGACDLIPLFGLNKRQIKQIAAHLGAPIAMVNKTPTADLECLDPGKTDETALGLTYEQIDDFLEGKPVDDFVTDKLVNTYLKTQHKRRPIPTIYD
ncbi:ammonia-dependent NAD(+) synthetase [Aliikangiella maris]|uniref:NH(3)-dependent NAD(+) synthetase n=2 Tax=Aliikangiella maris TaxID=3162458 RepID=A0ABV3MKD7_9GAMM